MKHFHYLLLCICAWPFCSSAQITNNGATIVITTGTQLILNDISLDNNGTFDQTAGTVVFAGSNATSVGGNNVPRFYDVNLNKSSGTLQLQSNIRIGHELRFTQGNLHLNTKNVLLDPGALLINENQTSYAYGPSGGYIEINQSLNAPSAINPGNLGAILSSSQNMGSVTIRRGHQAQANVNGSLGSIERYYDIIPVNNSGLNATLRLHYLGHEATGFNEALLTIWESTNNVNWTNLGRTGNNTTDKYVELNGIPDLARFTLSVPGNTLPLTWGSFHTQCLSGQVRISWKTEQEENTSQFIIRRSTDASNWTVIGTLPAAGHSNSSLEYSYNDPQPLPGVNYYQIQQKDIDGRLTVSPVLRNECGQTGIINVFPNPVQQSCWVSIQSELRGVVVLRLYDIRGGLVQQQYKTILNGNNQFELRTGNLSKGIYSLVITLPDGNNKVTKIEKL